jgi:hypothetical protein
MLRSSCRHVLISRRLFGFALLAMLSFIHSKGAALLASFLTDLYAAAWAAHEKATPVRPLGQDGVQATGP